MSSYLTGRFVLVVEDEFLIALDLKITLEAAGARVTITKARNAADVVVLKPERSEEIVATVVRLLRPKYALPAKAVDARRIKQKQR